MRGFELDTLCRSENFIFTLGCGLPNHPKLEGNEVKYFWLGLGWIGTSLVKKQAVWIGEKGEPRLGSRVE